MKKSTFLKTFIFPFVLITTLNAPAQVDSIQKEKTTFKLSLNYNSNLNYFGRTDSGQSSGVMPLAELWFNQNVYINASSVFVNNAAQKFAYAGTVATAGYQHLTDRTFTHFYFLKPFYTQSAELVQAALKGQSGFSISYLNRYVNFTAGGDVKWSDGVDFGATAGIDHLVRKEKRSTVFIINPSLYAYAGTQRFSYTYTRRKPGRLRLPGRDETVTESSNRFKVLAYEASVLLMIAKGAWQLTAAPAYVVPQNLLQVHGQPQLSEQGRPAFYTTAGIKYSF